MFCWMSKGLIFVAEGLIATALEELILLPTQRIVNVAGAAVVAFWKRFILAAFDY